VRRQLADPRLKESVVSARRHVVSFEVPFAARPDHCVLADAEQAGSFPAADQPGAGGHIGRCRHGELFDVLQAEAVMPAGRGLPSYKGPPRNRAENSRLADAQALGRLPRTDQSVQDVCRFNAAL
jgi:hypothetical protein